MGGHQAGEVASQLAIDTIRAFLASTQGDRDLTWPYGFNPALSFNGNRLLTAVKLANRRVFQAGEEEQTYSGMGTTIVAAMIEQDKLTFCGVGDSRLYILQAGELRPADARRFVGRDGAGQGARRRRVARWRSTRCGTS